MHVLHCPNGIHPVLLEPLVFPFRAQLSGWLTPLLGGEPIRRRRTSMAAVATAMMVSCALAMHVLAVSGELDAKVVNWWSFAAVSGLAFATVLIRSGWSERLADPSMTQFQMQWALTWNAVAYVIAGPLRALVLPVLVIILMYGIFGRNRRQTVSLMLYSMGLYTLAVFIAAHLQSPRPTNAMVAAHLTIVMLSLVAGTLMCLQVQSIRARLRQQKRELESALVQIRDLAMRDELTGLFNRRQMSELMALELRRCERSGQPLLLAQLDIDLFKEINDTHGHTAGDRALKAFADVVSGELRSGDVLARWGGEEFVLLLSEARKSHAAELLERLRKSVECASIPGDGEDIGMTVSIGWTEHQRGEPLEATLERADSALYEAKRMGRNRVVRVDATSHVRRCDVHRTWHTQDEKERVQSTEMRRTEAIGAAAPQ
jgi:diguanylate cyclase (GGDEF)-like protein